MGHNYGKHFNNNNPGNSHHIFGQHVEPTVDQVNELPSNEEHVIEPVESVETINVQETFNQEQFQNVTGVVSGCDRLNVRESDSKESKVLCIIENGVEVRVDLTTDNTASEFYKVTTQSGVVGYCMKKFINFK